MSVCGFDDGSKKWVDQGTSEEHSSGGPAVNELMREQQGAENGAIEM